MEQELFAKAVQVIIQNSCVSCWFQKAIECGLDRNAAEKIWQKAKMYCKEYDTPSGHLWSALDKFVYRYVKRGYKWSFCHDDDRNTDNNIIFTRGEETLLAIAKYENVDGHIKIIGYDIKPIANE